MTETDATMEARSPEFELPNVGVGPDPLSLARIGERVDFRQTQGDLVSETMLSPRTVRYALTKLEENDLITSDIYIPDARKNVYNITVSGGSK